MRDRLLLFISRLVTRHPWRVVLASLILALASIIISSLFLKMNTDQDDLVSEKLAYHKNYKDHLREFGDKEYLYIVVEADDNLPQAKDFTRALAKRLSSIPDVKEVTYQISNPKLEKSFLLYLPNGQISTIGEYLPKMEKIGSSADVFAMMNETIEHLRESQVAGNESRQLETGFLFLDKLLDGLIGAAKDDEAYRPFLQQAFFGGDRAFDEDGFLLSENGKLLFVMIMPDKNYKTLAVIDEPLKKIRTALDGTRSEFPNIKAGLTGRPVLAADEMRVSDTDMTLATIAAIFIVALIFFIYFKRPIRPAMAVLALICGILQTLGVTTLIIGHLNILSIVFAVILVGAGIEFGLQIVSRYREELAHHKSPARAVETCITQTGKGNMTACCTTAAAFFAMCLTNFLALQELGFIAGIGIILCLINMLTMLPALMFIEDRGKHPEHLHTTLNINLTRIASIYNRPRVVLIITLVATAALVPGLFRVSFNHNLLDLQAKGLESVLFEKKILAESSQSTWYVPFVTDTKESSLALAQKVKELPTVGKVETIEEVVPAGQDEKIAIIRVIASPKGVAISRNQSRGIASSAAGGLAMTHELKKFRESISHLTEMAFSAGETEAVESLEEISTKAGELIQLITGHETRINKFDKDFAGDLSKHIEMLRGGLTPERVTIEDMPETIQRRYVSANTGRYSFYAYPKEDVWDPAKMSAFIKDIRSVDPNVTGVPVEVYESSKLLERSFRQSAMIAILAIFIIVSLDFRNLRYTLLALAPLCFGVFWLFELMGIFGVKFNLANFFGIPIILGVGIDNAVQIVHRYIKDRHIEKVSSFMTRSTGVAVLLTSITTFASFGTLIFARHQGIASLGLVMSMGTLTCFIGSMLVLPCLLKIFGPRE
ncbi:MAG: hypothetical protein COV46_00955 [Deltaproteobacteria bacterium CG11_big_fil_rev_8_21_14_0_20_49_13]|nr:MAG: hypothetical protein COV46_00955 [Deltaproteobacteria bacterium CG11_big_fil_rev_8_21_14_0_20_49_13]